MIKPLSLLTGIAMAAAIGHTFEVKRSVTVLDRELRDIRRGTEEVEGRTQLLQAEWARLNDQERLRGLAERHLAGLAPMQSGQFQRLDEAVRRLPVAAGRPLRDPATVLRLYREVLDSLADPVDPGFGFDVMRLAALDTEHRIELFANPLRSRAQFGHIGLGHTRVAGWQTVASNR
jgi:hypothetical protein